MRAELLAPAGSYETMLAAYNAGADAVYIGGSAFGARAYADNPDEEMLLKAIRYAHLHHKKLYLTVNTLVKESEIEEFASYLRPYYNEGLDAAIVQDIGAFRLIREYFPDLAIHASTQMTITGEYSAKKLEELGATRVVTPRELSLSEIRAIHDTCNLEIESFVHGALCYCYSGQCLFSSIAGGRSGNRGRCAQPCRMAYELSDGKKIIVPEQSGYLLSPKDLNTIEKLPWILEAGIYSLKIEGRMKKPEYTAGVVSIYRKYLDYCLEKGEKEKFGKKEYFVSEEDKKNLFDLFNRKGFTDGYFFRQNSKNMITMTKPGMRPENEVLNREIREHYLQGKLKENIKGKVRIFAEEPVTIDVFCGKYSSHVKGELASAAQKRPLLSQDICRSMEKIRDTDFEWESLEIETDEHSFYPVGKLNELRRIALENLEKEICLSYSRTTQVKKSRYKCEDVEEAEAKSLDSLPWYASVQTKEQLDLLLETPWISRIYLDSHIAQGEELEKLARRIKTEGRECFFILPRIVRERAKIWMEKQLLSWKNINFDGYLVSSAEAVCFLSEKLENPVMIGDSMLYAWSKKAQQEWTSWGVSGLTAPVELNGKELKSRGLDGMELVLYGYQPMMITAQCLHQSSLGCTKKMEQWQLKDRMGNLFPVKNYCRECYNIIYNSRPLSLGDMERQIVLCHPKALRLDFTVESKKEMESVLAYYEVLAKGKAPLQKDFESTRGHWKRGVL